MNDLKKLLLAGIGGATLTIEKLDEIIEQLAEKGKLTAEHGQELRQQLIQKKKTAAGSSLSKDEILEALTETNIAQRKDIEELELKISQLSEKIDQLADK